MMNREISDENILIDSKLGGGQNKDSEKCILSIIVSVYNAEKYLETCLESLLNQDIDKSMYEIICVNDGSTDGSFAILKEYEKQYDNVVLIDKENEGVSIARNIGLEKARGDYVWFIDADDWVARQCFGIIKQEIEKYDPSVVQIGFDWIKAEWRIAEYNGLIN